MKIISKIFVCFILIVSVMPFVANAQEVQVFSVSINKAAAARGENIKLYLSLNGAVDLAVFAGEISFDDTSIEFVKAEKLNSDSLLECFESNSKLALVFSGRNTNIAKGNIIELTFNVLKETENAFAEFYIKINDCVNSLGENLGIDSELICDIEISEEPSDKAFLYELIPSYGALNEEFSEDRYLYTMSVPYSIKEIAFEYNCPQGARVSINRKNLGSGGSTSKFILTVTAADNITKKEYEVNVYRAEYQRTEIPLPEDTDIPYLISVTPSEGELNEEFRFDNFDYTMSVPYEINSLTFNVEATDGATTKINRKNLGSGGSITDFVITVTNGSSEATLYTISVKRGEYNRSSKPEVDAGDMPYILELIPSEGQLNEEFRFDKFDYTMNVPYDITSLSFEVKTTEGASSKINRKNLGSGGSTTDFIITVADENKLQKSIYTIAVTRGIYIRTSSSGTGNSSSTKTKITEAEESDEISTYIGDNGEKTVVSSYNQGAPLIITQNNFQSFALGGAIAIFSVIIGATVLVIVIRLIGKKGGHEK